MRHLIHSARSWTWRSVLIASILTGVQPAAQSQDRRAVTQTIHVEIPKLPLSAYASLAEDVVHVRVLQRGVVRRPGRIPRTRYLVSVLDSAYSKLSGPLTFTVGGASELGVRLIGAPGFEPGTEAVLFLERSPGAEHPHLLGLSSGTYVVLRRPDEGPRVTGLHARAERIEDFFDRVRAEKQRVAETQGGAR